ncbi:hypothetical protein GTA08_BOTSDO10377 [Neofusicoccum parvum]|nr:hypothetical protein GTA08_BOTSDO10377 [Neofusicoccum parvum]
MSLSPARPAAPLDPRSPSDATTLLPLHRRYTCGLTDVDCGNGYCCSVAHECVQQSGQTLCRLPGFASADQTAEAASDDATAAATSSASQTVCLSSSSTGDCVALGADGTASSSSGSSGLSAGAIAGIVVGVVAALAVVIGAVVFCLCARRRRKRREAAAGAAGRKEAGGGGYATQMPLGYQPVGGGDGLVDMYGGSNVGKMQGGVFGKAEVMGDTALPPAVQELPGSEVGRPVELDAGTEKK